MPKKIRNFLYFSSISVKIKFDKDYMIGRSLLRPFFREGETLMGIFDFTKKKKEERPYYYGPDGYGPLRPREEYVSEEEFLEHRRVVLSPQPRDFVVPKHGRYYSLLENRYLTHSEVKDLKSDGYDPKDFSMSDLGM